MLPVTQSKATYSGWYSPKNKSVNSQPASMSHHSNFIHKLFQYNFKTYNTTKSHIHHMYAAVSFKQKATKIQYKYLAYLCVLYILS